jgi:ADP-heptose:LPS heptosyltransferase
LRWAQEQAQADARLSDLRWFYDGFPDSCSRVHELGLGEFELLAMSSGIPVTADDLAFRLDVPAIEPFAEERPADLAGYAGCVTIHNSQGEGFGTKRLPPDVPEAIARAVARKGLLCVQVGRRDPEMEPPMMGAVDLRGLRLPETARVIGGAVLHVDVEGMLVKIARAVRTKSVVFFGPTPPVVFGLEGNANYTRGICPDPWGPHCFWKRRGWNKQCPLGFEHCANLPQPEAAVRVVIDALDALDAPPKPAISIR